MFAATDIQRAGRPLAELIPFPAGIALRLPITSALTAFSVVKTQLERSQMSENEC